MDNDVHNNGHDQSDSATPAPADKPVKLPNPRMPSRINETIQTVLTALLLAFVFRAFWVEAFIIPTGSMAESLLGVHVTAVCPRCGNEFDYGPATSNGNGRFRHPRHAVCPNCHFAVDVPEQALPPTVSGDRILVSKWPFLIGGPFDLKRWDVIVFRDPADTEQNYVKRLIGLPGDTIEIIAGDIFINGEVARKTPVAQQQLWTPVYDQSLVPSRDYEPLAQRVWVPDVSSGQTLGWSGFDTRVLHYRDLTDASNTIRFSVSRPIRDMAGYNNGDSDANVGDLRICTEAVWHDGDGFIQFELGRGDNRFRATLYADGRSVLEITPESEIRWQTIGSQTGTPFFRNMPIFLEFGHVDGRAYLQVNGRELLNTDAGYYQLDIDWLRREAALPPAEIFITASDGNFDLRTLRVDRDVYYISHGSRTKRAGTGKPFTLRDDEYFVLGDNSGHSYDSREWSRVAPEVHAYYEARAKRNDETSEYRYGTVRRELIVGRATFVYLPGLQPLDREGRWRYPDISRMRFVR